MFDLFGIRNRRQMRRLEKLIRANLSGITRLEWQERRIKVDCTEGIFVVWMSKMVEQKNSWDDPMLRGSVTAQSVELRLRSYKTNAYPY